jgi:hypothetical protein
MRFYFAAVAFIALLAQLARLWIAWEDYKRRWVRLPADEVYRQPKTKAGAW